MVVKVEGKFRFFGRSKVIKEKRGFFSWFIPVRLVNMFDLDGDEYMEVYVNVEDEEILLKIKRE